MVSVKLSVCVGLVERQASFSCCALFGADWHMFLVWHKAVLRRVGRGLGSAISNFLYVIPNLSGVDLVFFKRKHVHSKDNGLCISVVFDNRRTTFLETISE